MRHGINGHVQLVSFHAFHGPTLRLGVGERGARRQHSFSGVCFSARPLRPRRPFMVRIDEVEYGWTGHLRLGVTSLDPASHPDLSSRWVRTCAGRIRCRHFMEHTSLVAFPQVHSAHTRVGDLVGVYFEPVGADWIRIHLLANGLDICPEQEPLHVPAGAEQPLFVVLDVFGMTRKVTVMPMVRSVSRLSSICERSILHSLERGRVSAELLPLPLPMKDDFASRCAQRRPIPV